MLHIGGYIRSGSTLLGQLLGELPGVIFVGELKYIWEEGCRRDELCGCRQRFSLCPFWREVVREGLAKFDGAELERVLELQRTVERMRYLPALAVADGTALRRRTGHLLKEYRQLTGELMSAIARVSGSRIIVDSSKDPAYALVLSRVPGVALRILHLTRDSRAVAFSNRRKKPNYRQPGVEELMKTQGPLQSALEWSVYNTSCAAIAWLGRRRLRYARIRYEDLARQPGAVLDAALRALGLDVRRDFGFIRDGAAYLKVNHAIDGNPGRFAVGRVPISADEAWREKLSRKERRLATLLTWPLLRWYGYRA